MGSPLFPSKAEHLVTPRHQLSSSSTQDLESRRLSLRLTRRSILRTGTFAALFPVCGQAPLPASARAQRSEAQWRAGLSLFGELKYRPGFKHFDYVNPQSPKGG